MVNYYKSPYRQCSGKALFRVSGRLPAGALPVRYSPTDFAQGIVPDVWYSSEASAPRRRLLFGSGCWPPSAGTHL